MTTTGFSPCVRQTFQWLIAGVLKVIVSLNSKYLTPPGEKLIGFGFPVFVSISAGKNIEI